MTFLFAAAVILSGRMQVCEKGMSGCVQGEEVIEKAVTGGAKYVNPVHCLTRWCYYHGFDMLVSHPFHT